MHVHIKFMMYVIYTTIRTVVRIVGMGTDVDSSTSSWVSENDLPTHDFVLAWYVSLKQHMTQFCNNNHNSVFTKWRSLGARLVSIPNLNFVWLKLISFMLCFYVYTSINFELKL